MQKEVITKRLKNIEGHIRGIAVMVGQDAYCIDVIQQIQAARASLNKLNILILDNHLHSCMTTAVRGNNVEEREKVLKEITQLYETATKV